MNMKSLEQPLELAIQQPEKTCIGPSSKNGLVSPTCTCIFHCNWLIGVHTDDNKLRDLASENSAPDHGNT